LFRTAQLTFLRPAPTQERAAEQLHLSFSTYRRYRDRAVALMIERLWQRELYGLDSESFPASPGPAERGKRLPKRVPARSELSACSF